jgi:hypothetical protein
LPQADRTLRRRLTGADDNDPVRHAVTCAARRAGSRSARGPRPNSRIVPLSFGCSALSDAGVLSGCFDRGAPLKQPPRLPTIWMAPALPTRHGETRSWRRPHAGARAPRSMGTRQRRSPWSYR